MTWISQFKSAGADVSDCQQYCYRIWRQWDDSLPTLGFILLSPQEVHSTENNGDIGRCLMRGVDTDYGGIEVVYLFSRQVLDPSHLEDDPRYVGDAIKAQAELLGVLDRSSIVICAWGSHSLAPARAEQLLGQAVDLGYGNCFFHLGLNKDGSPKDMKQMRGRPRSMRWKL